MKKCFSKITPLLKKTYPGEIFAAVVITGLINNFYYPDEPGFLNTFYNPYFLIIVFFSSFYGKLSGFLCLALSLISMSIVTTYTHDAFYFFNHFINIELSNGVYNSLMKFLFMTLLFSFVLGEIRDSAGGTIQNLKDINKILSDTNNKLEHEIKAVSMINEEYQDRILGQQNSLISLYSTMISLNSLDLEKIYPNILNAVVKFSGATSCSLWQYRRDERTLVILSTYGWDNENPFSESKILDSDSIAGWAARNNEIFSVKILQKHPNLLSIDKKQNIITVPINIGHLVWGVINIEKMPFVKYNQYSEQLIMMIADLASPIINNAIRFDEISRKGEIDSITALPALDEMFSVLKEEFNKALNENLKLSLALLELTNAEDLLEEYSINEVMCIIRDIAQLVKKISKGDVMLFQYKEKFQFSIILPNLDFDGAAMFCLSVIEEHGKTQYKIKEDIISPEIVMGYSSIRSNHRSEEDLMALAENLLLIQKI